MVVKIIYVEKKMKDAHLENRMSKKLKRTDIDLIIQEDTDVFRKEDGKLLLRFRKGVLPKDHIDDFYENIIDFANLTSGNRGIASNSKTMTLATNPRIKSNIFGYFDSWAPTQKVIFTRKLGKIPLAIRECRFNRDFPEQYKRTIPLIRKIDELYKKLVPECYSLQKKKANETPFRIGNTAFTTVTTNVNFQTAVHTDKGDDEEGFGNLAVIERGGHYSGGETCFPQYRLGVDVREGDILFMDVHEPHANLPMVFSEEGATRLSIVCYLRKRIWLHSRGKTASFREKHNRTIRRILGTAKVA
jgi:hypothetical protein